MEIFWKNLKYLSNMKIIITESQLQLLRESEKYNKKQYEWVEGKIMNTQLYKYFDDITEVRGETSRWGEPGGGVRFNFLNTNVSYSLNGYHIGKTREMLIREIEKNMTKEYKKELNPILRRSTYSYNDLIKIIANTLINREVESDTNDLIVKRLFERRGYGCEFLIKMKEDGTLEDFIKSLVKDIISSHISYLRENELYESVANRINQCFD